MRTASIACAWSEFGVAHFNPTPVGRLILMRRLARHRRCVLAEGQGGILFHSGPMELQGTVLTEPF